MSEDVQTEDPQVEKRAFQTEVQQLLHLLVHSLYTQKEIFLRELISNASDALDKIHHRSLTDRNILDPDAELDIELEVSSSNKTLTIRDRGIGMTRDEVNENIGTIARSGSAEFAAKLADADDEQEKLKLIGQFGVGFYSVFMVADRVVITTRAADPDADGRAVGIHRRRQPTRYPMPTKPTGARKSKSTSARTARNSSTPTG